MRDLAIRNTHPTVVIINAGTEAYDAQGNRVELNETTINTEIARLQAEYDAKEYQRKRAAEYPSIGDQLDALWKGGDAAAEMLAKVQAVKTKYPKP